MPLIRRHFGRRADGNLSPREKRLLFILDNFGRRYPAAAADTVQILLQIDEPFTAPERWANLPNPVSHARATVLAPEGLPGQTHRTIRANRPARGALDRWGRWVFAQVRAARSARGSGWRGMKARDEARMRAGLLRVSAAVGAAVETCTSPKAHAANRHMRELVEGLTPIREWIINGNGRPQGTFRQTLRAAQAWHTAVLERQIDAAQVQLGLAEGASTAIKIGGGWSVVALVSRDQLAAEGSVMRHCVGSYYRQVMAGRTTIFSLRKNGAPKVTFEIIGGQVHQAKAYRDAPAATIFGTAVNTETLSALSQTMDVETGIMVLTTMQRRGWTSDGAFQARRDLVAVEALQLHMAAEAAKKAAKAAKAAKKGRRVAVGGAGLTYKDAQALMRHVKDHAKGVRLGAYTLHQEDRNGTTVYALYAPRALQQLMADARDDQGNTITRRTRAPGRYGHRALQRKFKVAPFPSVEFWPDRWVIRGRLTYGGTRSDISDRIVGMEYTPLSILRVTFSRRGDQRDRRVSFEEGHNQYVIAFQAQPGRRTARIGNKPVPWAFWPIPTLTRHCRQNVPARASGSAPRYLPADRRLVITVDAYGVPSSIETEPITWNKLPGLWLRTSSGHSRRALPAEVDS